MYVECPQCKALYRIAPSQLDAAEGWVRCGECGHIFDAREMLGSPDEPFLHSALDLDADIFEQTAQPTVGQGEPEEVPAPPTAEEKEPVGPRQTKPLGTLTWTLAILVLIGILGVQYLLSQRDQFARYPEMRPVLAQLCRIRGCTLPPLRDLTAIELASRNVFTHPNIPHALMITATMINNAPFAQPYPILQISFSNLEGKTVALGRFKPAQYLPKGLSADKMMPTGKPIRISISVNDPGQQALAYEFSFH